MNCARTARIAIAIALGLALSGCGFVTFPSNATKARQPAAPIIGEPSLVRVHTGKLSMAQGAADPFSPPGEETADKGFRFIEVGFPIGAKQTLVMDDYELLDDADDPQVPFAVGGEGPGAPQFFYGTEDFADSVVLTKGTQEVTGMKGQGADESALVVSWETTSPIVLMLFEIPADVKSITLRHGTRTFKLEPDAGLIDGKSGTAK